jgi:hypothetical protein
VTKVAVWIGIVMTIPAVIIAGFLIADPFYIKFIFEGDLKDFAPGDAIGVFLCSCVFAIVISIPAMFGWWRLYRRISRRLA